MARQGSYCCTTPRALCFWCATFLVLYGGGLLLFSVWPALWTFDQTLLLAAVGGGCVANVFVNRTFHCGLMGPMFLFAAAVVGFGESGHWHVNESLVWSLLLIGIGLAGFAEWRVTRNSVEA